MTAGVEEQRIRIRQGIDTPRHPLHGSSEHTGFDGTAGDSGQPQGVGGTNSAHDGQRINNTLHECMLPVQRPEGTGFARLCGQRAGAVTERFSAQGQSPPTQRWGQCAGTLTTGLRLKAECHRPGAGGILLGQGVVMPWRGRGWPWRARWCPGLPCGCEWLPGSPRRTRLRGRIPVTLRG